jgi:hypothetical protein
MTNCRQLTNCRHTRVRIRSGGGTHRSDAAEAGAWRVTSEGMPEAYTALAACQRRLAWAECGSHPGEF